MIWSQPVSRGLLELFGGWRDDARQPHPCLPSVPPAAGMRLSCVIPGPGASGGDAGVAASPGGRADAGGSGAQRCSGLLGTRGDMGVARSRAGVRAGYGCRVIPRESRGVLGRAASARGIRARPGRNAQGARGNAGIAAPPGILRESRVRSGTRGVAASPGIPRESRVRSGARHPRESRVCSGARHPRARARPGRYGQGARGNAGIAAPPGISREPGESRGIHTYLRVSLGVTPMEREETRGSLRHLGSRASPGVPQRPRVLSRRTGPRDYA